MGHKLQITFDASNPAQLAKFWQEAMGYEEQPPPPGFDSWEAFADANHIPVDQRDNFGAAIDPDGGGPRLLFLKVPEGKEAKNRMHLDVYVTNPEGHVARLVEIGATKVDERSEFGHSWTVMADPEGNEFCVAEPPPAD